MRPNWVWRHREVTGDFFGLEKGEKHSNVGEIMVFKFNDGLDE
jgi:hypothetical protein